MAKVDDLILSVANAEAALAVAQQARFDAQRAENDAQTALTTAREVLKGNVENMIKQAKKA